jgi:hypothetical protein
MKGTCGYYLDKEGEFQPNKYAWAVPGPTSLFTTATDLAKWMKNFNDQQLGGPTVMDLMFQRGVLNDGTQLKYAFGLEISNYRGIKTIYHEGGWAGFRSVVVLFPEQKFSVVVLSNMALGVFNPAPYALQIADIYLAHQLAKITPSPQKLASIPPRRYDAYVGQYILPLPYSKPKLVTIMREKDRLLGQLEGKPQRELLPQSETTFFVKDENIQLTFTPDENGKYNHFTAQIGDGLKLLPARRLQRLNGDQLKAYTGDFRSPELATTWRISIQGNRLLAKHQLQKSVRLFSNGADRFTGDQWWFQEVIFDRDDRGRIIGFRLTAEDGLVRRLAFKKN